MVESFLEHGFILHAEELIRVFDLDVLERDVGKIILLLIHFDYLFLLLFDFLTCATFDSFDLICHLQEDVLQSCNRYTKIR